MTNPNQLYDAIGATYTHQRRPDPRVHAAIRAELGTVRSVINVGAGAGSYEPDHVPTFAVEPSLTMIRQRVDRSPVIQGAVETLPFVDNACDAVLAVLTVHHWAELSRGLEECARVASKQVTLLTWDPEAPPFWLTKAYFPSLLDLDRRIFPSLDRLRAGLGPVQVSTVLIPADCTDGFTGAFWRRPAAYLDERVRAGMSSFQRIGPLKKGLTKLRDELASGKWAERHGGVLKAEEVDLGYRLVTATVG